MRAYELRGGGIAGLTLVERPPPRPGPGQVLVAMRAASINYRDLAIADQIKKVRIPLSDGAGEVIETGPGVTSIAPGARVAGAFFQRWVDGPFDPSLRSWALGGPIDGVLAEQVVLEETGVTGFPDTLSFEEAACLPCAGVTAWVGLVEHGGLEAGETVLAMGTGGVSVFSLQLAKSMGARVILTSSHDEKLARGRSLGADEVINYQEVPDWDLRARELTGGRGVDHILEVGGAGTIDRSIRATRVGGPISIVGLLSGSWPSRETKNERGLRVDEVYVGSLRHFEAFNRAILRSGLRPVVDRVFSFEEARDAYEHVRSGKHFGKIVIRIK
jgi:NADPH:quinone reductase-like Zn-dependent oxidoreductase